MATLTQLPSGSWRVQIRRKGVATLSETFKTKEEAERWGRSREAELLTSHHKAVPRVAEGLLFKDAVERYFTSPVFQNKAPSTQARERSCSKRVLEFLGEYSLNAIDGALVQDYIDTRTNEEARKGVHGVSTGKKVSGHTVRLEKAFLSSVFKFSKRRNLVPSNVMRDTFEMPNYSSRDKRVTLKQQTRLFEVAERLAESPKTNKSLLPWLYFVFETGTRPGEAAKAEITWFDLEQRKVSIPRSGQKKRNPRVVLLGDDLAELLRERISIAKQVGSPFVFWSRSNSRRERNAEGKVVRRNRTAEQTAQRKIIRFAYYSAWVYLCQEAGIPTDINPHAVRHEFISRLYEDTDLNDGQIAALVGDVNVLSLADYRHLRVDRLRDKQSAHLDEVRKAMAELQRQKQERLEKHVTGVLAAAQKERAEAGDFSTPLERIRARIKAQALISEIAYSEEEEE